MLKNIIPFSSVVITSLLLASCSSHKESFLTAYACVDDDNDFRDTFPILISEISYKYDLLLVDKSSETNRQLERIKSSGRVDNSVKQTINLGLFQGDNLKVKIGNLGLSPHSVLISFFENGSRSQDRRLARDVIKALKQRWPVETVPAGKSLFPIEGCNVAK